MDASVATEVYQNIYIIRHFLDTWLKDGDICRQFEDSEKKGLTTVLENNIYFHVKILWDKYVETKHTEFTRILNGPRTFFSS